MNDRTAMRLLIFFIGLIVLGAMLNLVTAVHSIGLWLGWW
jgi:hypothetical protein